MTACSEDSGTGSGSELTFRVTFSCDDGRACIVAVAGDVDLANAQVLAELLDAVYDVGAVDTWLDAADLAYIDSVGIEVLVAQAERFRAGGRRIQVLREGRRLGYLLRITGTAHLLGVDPMG